MTDTPNFTASSAPCKVRHWVLRAEWLLYLGYAALLAFAMLGPYVPQAAGYHAFADQRSWGHLPHAVDVLSNLPFLLFGLCGLYTGVLRAPQAVRQYRAWMVLIFGGLVATALGSGYYHLAPDDWGVFWDRMGMLPVFAGVLGLAVQQHVGRRPAWVTAVLVLLGGSMSLWVWLQSTQLLPWAVVQGGGMVVLLMVALWQWRHRLAAPHTQWAWGTVLAWYVLAKLLELGDQAVWAASDGWVAGHSLKHVAAAMAVWPLLCKLCQPRRAQWLCQKPA